MIFSGSPLEINLFASHPERRSDSKEEFSLKNAKIKRMASIALLMALVVVMQFISSMIPPVSGFSFSLVLLPIVLGAALYGPSAGAVLGGTFGAVVYINCMTGADVGGAMVFQASPVLCFAVVLGKGVLAGALAGATYGLLKGTNQYAAMLLAAIVCPVVNTGVFVLAMVTLFQDVISAWATGFGTDLLTYIFSGLLLLNFVPELIINMVFSPASVRIMRVANKNN